MGQVKKIPNSIGYVEITFAKANNLPTALIKNKAGEFVEPTIENISAAAAGSVKDMPEDMRAQITNADGDKRLSDFELHIYFGLQRSEGRGQRKALVDFLWWAIHDGEKFTNDLHYAPLPAEVVKKVEAKINSITADGKPLRQ